MGPTNSDVLGQITIGPNGFACKNMISGLKYDWAQASYIATGQINYTIRNTL